MTTFAVLGALVGVGVLLVTAGLRGPSAELETVVAQWDTVPIVSEHRRDEAAPSTGRRPVLLRTGAIVDRIAERLGRGRADTVDLAILGRSSETHHATVGVTTVGLALAGVVAVTGLSAVGLGLPVFAPLVGAILGAVVGAAAPAAEVHRSAERIRAQFLRGLSCWLELVSMAQAGGMGVESALEAASAISADSSFSRIRSALDGSRRAGTTPWHALGRLGRDLGIPALEELAASLALAGTEGARVRTSLSAKSASLRRHQMAAAESEANATTERLFLPSIVLMAAFMVFLMFPAAASLAHVIPL